MQYTSQPYYAQLLSFQLGLDTAYHEKQKTERAWKLRYCYCHKNPKWNDSILFGEPGWQPAVIQMPPSPWRSMHPVFYSRRYIMSILDTTVDQQLTPLVKPPI